MLDLSFANGEESLSVRRFEVTERLSAPFEARVTAVSPHEDLDLATFVGQAAALTITGGAGRAPATRTLRGVVCAMELVRSEGAGLSTYEITLAHETWLLKHRRDHRVFQRMSIPEIVGKVLAEWGVEASFHVDAVEHPTLEYRVQYGESDLAFVHRLLEEAGIAYVAFEEERRRGLAFFDAIEAREPRALGPIAHADEPSRAALGEYVTGLRILHEVRPTKLALRDIDVHGKPEAPLTASVTAAAGSNGASASGEGGSGTAAGSRLEQYVFSPGSFLSLGGKGGAPVPFGAAARARVDVGALRANRALGAARSGARRVAFTTNAIDLCPGTVFSITGHAHGDLGPGKKLLVTEMTTSGTHDGEWQIAATGVLADVRYRPPQSTPKPVVHGVQSAVVVGPPGEEIHVDEMGRVKVQFAWDREGRLDEHSSSWLRVSQGWAGAGLGLVALPRVGQEVLVGFFEGDPDQPIVVGRVFNGASPLPHRLPENRTRSTWKSSSVPGGDGSNELTFEDAKGRELVYLQAERNLEEMVRVDQSLTVGQNRIKQVGVDETEVIGATQTISVGLGRSANIGGSDSTVVGLRHAVSVAQAEGAGSRPPTATEMSDRRITLTTGEATITLEGPNITLSAAASILLDAASEIAVHGRANIKVMSGASVRVEAEDGEVVIQGGPCVQINPQRGGKDAGDALPVEIPPEVHLEAHAIEAEENRWFKPEDPHWFQRQTSEGGEWDPKRWGKEHEDFGVWNLGFVGRAAGVPRGVIVRQAGLRNVKENGPNPDLGDPGNGVFGGKAPFGNDPKKLELVRKGMAHYDEEYA